HVTTHLPVSPGQTSRCAARLSCIGGQNTFALLIRIACASGVRTSRGHSSAPPRPGTRYIMGQQFSGAAAIRAAAMIMGSTYVTYAVGLLVSIIVARSLGPEDFGRYSYVVWVAGILL